MQQKEVEEADADKAKTKDRENLGGMFFVIACLTMAVALYFAIAGDSRKPESIAATYRLVHTIGNDEHVAGRDLSALDCETRKQDLKATATALGTFNEQTGYGSIACLPESLFAQ